jgi:hypothetical protein
MQLPLGGRQRRRDADDEIGDLVSISIECASRVQDALQQTQQVLSQTRRKMRIGVAAIWSMLTLIVVAIALNHLGTPTGSGRARVVNEVMGTSDPRLQNSEQLLTARAEMGAPRERNLAPEHPVRTGTPRPFGRDRSMPAAADEAPDAATTAPGPTSLRSSTASDLGAGPTATRSDVDIPSPPAARRTSSGNPPPLWRGSHARARASEQAIAAAQDEPVPMADPVPSSVGGRVVIHYRGGSGAEIANQMAALASPLATRVQTRLVGGTPSRTEIRFFYSADEPKARRLAATLRSLAPEVNIRNFVAFRPGPSPGTIEVWVPSQG